MSKSKGDDRKPASAYMARGKSLQVFQIPCRHIVFNIISGKVVVDHRICIGNRSVNRTVHNNPFLSGSHRNHLEISMPQTKKKSQGSAEKRSRDSDTMACAAGLADTEALDPADMAALAPADTEALGRVETEALGPAETVALGLEETVALGLEDTEAEMVVWVDEDKAPEITNIKCYLSAWKYLLYGILCEPAAK